MRESLRREWRALCKQADKADGLFSARPVGLAALSSLGVGAFRRATSPSVIAALMLLSAVSQRRTGLVHRFLSEAMDKSCTPLCFSVSTGKMCFFTGYLVLNES